MPTNNQLQPISKKAENLEEQHKAISDLYQLFRMIPLKNKTCIREPISIPGIHSVHFVTINSKESSEYEETQPQKPDRRLRTSEPVTIDFENIPGNAGRFEKTENKFEKLKRRKRGHPLTPDAIASTTSSINTRKKTLFSLKTSGTPSLDTKKTESSSSQTSGGSETTSGSSQSGVTGSIPFLRSNFFYENTGSSDTEGTKDATTTDQPKSTGSTEATDTTGELSTSSLKKSSGSTGSSSATGSSGSTEASDTTGKLSASSKTVLTKSPDSTGGTTKGSWIPGIHPMSLHESTISTTGGTTPAASSGAESSGSTKGTQFAAEEVVDQEMAHSMEVLDDEDEYAIVDDSDMDKPNPVASYEDYYRPRHLDSGHIARSVFDDGPKFLNYRKADNKGVPGKPRRAQIAHMGRKEIVLTWLAPKIEGGRPAPDGYIVQMKDGDGNFKVMGKPVATYFAVDKLTAGRTYFFKISSRGKTGNSSPLAVKYNMDDDTFED